MSYCRDYLTIQLIFAAFNMMQVLYQNLFVTAGKPTLGLVLAVLAGIANIVFDYIFIVLLQMGIKGAAIGTGIGTMIPSIIGTIFFLRGSRLGAGEVECGDRLAAERSEGAIPYWSRLGEAEVECGDRIAAERSEGAIPYWSRLGAGEVGCGDRLAAERSELHFCKPDMDASGLLKSCSNGVSELVSQCSTAVTTFLFNSTMMNLLGEDGVAAITVLIYSQFLLTTLTIGFSMGTAPVVSYNYGSGNVKQLKKTVRICFSFIVGISIVVFLCSLFGGESIAKVFAENNKNVFEIAKNGFIIFHSAFCSLDAIFFLPHYLRHYPMGKRPQLYLSCGHLDLLRCSFWHCRDF